MNPRKPTCGPGLCNDRSEIENIGKVGSHPYTPNHRFSTWRCKAGSRVEDLDKEGADRDRRCEQPIAETNAVVGDDAVDVRVGELVAEGVGKGSDWA